MAHERIVKRLLSVLQTSRYVSLRSSRAVVPSLRRKTTSRHYCSKCSMFDLCVSCITLTCCLVVDRTLRDIENFMDKCLRVRKKRFGWLRFAFKHGGTAKRVEDLKTKLADAVNVFLVRS